MAFDAIHASLKSRIGKGAGQLKLRLVQPEYTIATSDGIRNGTREMRYSLIGREVTHDALCEHLSATGLAGMVGTKGDSQCYMGVAGKVDGRSRALYGFASSTSKETTSGWGDQSERRLTRLKQVTNLSGAHSRYVDRTSRSIERNSP